MLPFRDSVLEKQRTKPVLIKLLKSRRSRRLKTSALKEGGGEQPIIARPDAAYECSVCFEPLSPRSNVTKPDAAYFPEATAAKKSAISGLVILKLS